jgi:hypothetical protein
VNSARVTSLQPEVKQAWICLRPLCCTERASTRWDSTKCQKPGMCVFEKSQYILTRTAPSTCYQTWCWYRRMSLARCSQWGPAIRMTLCHDR